MSAWKQDSLATLALSAVLTILLFFVRQYLDLREDSSGKLPSREVSATAPTTPEFESGTREHGQFRNDTFRTVGVIDGDTVDVLKDGKPQRLRLAGIDCPEKGQPFGRTAKSALSDRIGGKFVRVVVTETDRYGRSIADIYDDDGHINEWLVQQGLAWHYTAFSDNADLAAAQIAAKQRERGLWSDPRHVAPWNWRKLSKIERDQFR